MNRLPHIGLRIIKTAAVIFLSLAVSWLRAGQSNSLYIAIAAMLAIQPTMESAKNEGVNRLVGTLSGGIWGTAVFLINIFVLGRVHVLVQYLFISLAIIPLILTSLKLKRPATVSIACVVFLVVATSPVGEVNPLRYVGNRMLDTFIGFVIGMIVNPVRLPDKTENNE